MASVQDESGYNQGYGGSWSTAVRARRRGELIAGRMTPRPGGRILEIGCGRGELGAQLAATTGMAVLAVDSSEGFVEEARRRHEGAGVTYRVADFSDAASIGDGPFDYIVGNGILHHLHARFDRALEAIGALLVPGGGLVFMEPNLHNPYVYLTFTRPRLRAWARLDPDEMAFSRAWVRAHLARAGFGEVNVEYRDFLLPGVPRWAVRPLIGLGWAAERTPGARQLAQSLLISARR